MPMGGNLCRGAHDESSFTEMGMRNGQVFRHPDPAAPQHDIDIERASAPALTGTAASERALDPVQQI